MRTPFPWARALLAAAMISAFVMLLAPAFTGTAFADGKGKPPPDVAEPPITHAAPPPAAPAHAAPLPAASPATTAVEAALAPASGRSGDIAFPGGTFALAVPESYKFYDAAEAQRFIQARGTTAPSGQVLGLIAPASADVRAPDTWGTVLSYEAVGHVAPESASALQATDFEGDVRRARQTQNRAFEGFSVTPLFDPASAQLTWAERTAAPGAGGQDLRYEQRLLSKQGYVGLTTLGSQDQLGAVVAASPDITGMIKFNSGEAYGDFNAASDAVSALGVADLITGVRGSADQLVGEAASTGGNASTRGGGLTGYFPWIALGVIGLAAFGYIATRKRKDPDLIPGDEE